MIKHKKRQIVLTLICCVVRMRAVAWFFVVAFFGWGGFEIGTPDPVFCSIGWPNSPIWTTWPTNRDA